MPADFPNEWDLVLGKNQDDQGRRLAAALRRERSVGDLVNLVGGKSFGAFGRDLSQGANRDQGELALIARHRQMAAQEDARQAQTGKFQDAQMERMKAQEAIERARLAAEREWRRAQQGRWKMEDDTKRAAIDAKKKGATTNTPLGALPRKIGEKVNDLDIKMGEIRGAMAMVKQKPDAFGLTKSLPGLFPDAPGASLVRAMQNNARPKEEAFVRAHVFGPVAKAIHELYGAALTKVETSRPAEFLPQENDNAEKVVEKLRAALRLAEKERAVTMDNYKGNPEFHWADSGHPEYEAPGGQDGPPADRPRLSPDEVRRQVEAIRNRPR